MVAYVYFEFSSKPYWAAFSRRCERFDVDFLNSFFSNEEAKIRIKRRRRKITVTYWEQKKEINNNNKRKRKIKSDSIKIHVIIIRRGRKRRISIRSLNFSFFLVSRVYPRRFFFPTMMSLLFDARGRRKNLPTRVIALHSLRLGSSFYYSFSSYHSQ